uniref:Carboxylic ester hydrolase n=1 Tax=Lygus lineolaris TaxID=50650 RepID=I3WNT2_LYGLI|nr:esterase [Lygus lineolaris]
MWVLTYAAIGTLFTASIAQQPVVTTTLGTLKGLTLKTISGRPFHAFQGVPYAKPPVGKHRFKQSIPGDRWTGIYNATRASEMCIQKVTSFLLPNSPIDIFGSEDCLYLNIFTPKLPSEGADGKLLDVIVYIHGGGFRAAAGNVWGPSILLDRDVVLVTFNYRLGMMGFLSFGDSVMPGNNGLKDQTLALQWVKNHIADFGGDPNKVTIAGMSAGGASVHYHMLSPLSKGLFQKAIANSGSALNPWAMSRTARKTGLALAQAIGCPTNDTTVTLKCLRERPAGHLLNAADLIEIELPMKFVPVVEPVGPKAFIDEDPVDLIKSKAGSDVPALFSYCDDEGSEFALPSLVDEKTESEIENNWNQLILNKLLFVESDKTNEASQKIRKHFLDDKKIKENLQGYSKMFGERYFIDGIQKAAILHAEHQSSPVYSYRFSFRTPKGFNALELGYARLQYEGGASHGIDNAFLFNAMYLKPIQEFPELLPMTKYMTDVWMKFIEQTGQSDWSTVKSALPKFTYLDIWNSDPSKNTFKSEEPVGLFWDSLNLHR